MGEGIKFLHLRLARSSEPAIRDLLISDVSGEYFKSLRDSTDACRQAHFLKRADTVCIIVDGALLADPAARHIASTDTTLLIRSLLEANAIHHECNIQVSFTKWDLVLNARDSLGAVNYATRSERLSITSLVNVL